VTTASLPQRHTAQPGLPGWASRILFSTVLACASLPLLASNTASVGTDAGIPAQVAIASPDTAPLHAQLDALPQAQPAPTASERVKTVLQRAFSLLGTPYRWGGSSPENGFDCSGLVGYVFRTIGIDLPRVSRAMAHEGAPVTDRAALTEGDLVFFGRNGGRVDHVGIYIGDGKFVHAPRTGRDVTVSSLATGYWSQKYLQARRLAVGS
jgi:cell wall-associated NlpC family hydrolase